MKCQCGSGYCPVDNVTYPCECEEISVQEIQELKALVEEDYEEDDLPFQVSLFLLVKTFYTDTKQLNIFIMEELSDKEIEELISVYPHLRPWLIIEC